MLNSRVSSTHILLLLALATCPAMMARESIASDAGLWKFVFMIQNCTGHDITIRALEGNRLLFEKAVPGETVVSTRTPQGLPYTNVDGTPIPDHFRMMQVSAPLHPDTRQITVEETTFLKTTKTFDIATFKNHPEADFRIFIDGQGIRLTQDFKISGPDPMTSAELAEERQRPSYSEFLIMNKSGKPLDLLATVDGRTVFAKQLQSRLPGVETTPPPRNPTALPRVPIERFYAPVGILASSLTLTERESLPVTKTFDISGWATRPGELVIEVTREGLSLVQELIP
jgi:hypothetical protein